MTEVSQRIRFASAPVIRLIRGHKLMPHELGLPAPPPLVIYRSLDVGTLDLAGSEKAQEDSVGQSNSAEPR
jgi:hypothetical protein